MNTAGRLITTGSATLVLLGAAALPVAAAERSWAASHGASTASGTTILTAESPFPWGPAAYELSGELVAQGSCSTVWLSQGLLPGLGSDPVRLAEACGEEPVAFAHSGVSDRSSGIRSAVWVQVCAGVADRTDCGPAVVVD